MRIELEVLKLLLGRLAVVLYQLALDPSTVVFIKTILLSIWRCECTNGRLAVVIYTTLVVHFLQTPPLPPKVEMATTKVKNIIDLIRLGDEPNQNTDHFQLHCWSPLVPRFLQKQISAMKSNF